MTPIFLLSLPRSGSTVLQRTLAGHSEIASAPETWLLLPLAAMSGAEGVRVYTNYSHKLARIAMEDFTARLPAGEGTYRRILRETALALYTAAGGQEQRYFLDKTPRYFLIVDFILEMFPEAPVLLLVRNPVDVLSSIITTWGGDRLWVHPALVDLYQGPAALHDAMRRHADRLFVVEYDAFVSEPARWTREICDYLGIDFEEGMLVGASSATMGGRMGDMAAKEHGTPIGSDAVERWRQTLATPLRRWFARRYLRRLGPEILASFRVDGEKLDRELANMPVQWRRTWVDAVALMTSFAAASVAGAAIWNQWRRKGSSPVTKLD